MTKFLHRFFTDSTDRQNEIIGGKYCIKSVLGKGSVAITYKAINLKTNTPVAIKAISLKRLDNWKQIELFQREAKVLAKLNHPNIPQYIDYFDIETKTDKAFYIVQQLAPGKSLAELVESGWRSSEAEVKLIAKQILAILKYLHSLNPPVIHRDIKPNNLILSDDGKIYLVDFGAVQNIYYDTVTHGSTVIGTFGYMAPEQFRGKASAATDLYSLGATILYLLTRCSPAELPLKSLKLDFRNSVDISNSFANWLEQILEPDLELRFASAEVAVSELFASKKSKQKSVNFIQLKALLTSIIVGLNTSKPKIAKLWSKSSQNKFIKNISIGVLTISVLAGLTSYRWWWLSRLGFYPDEMCSPAVSQKFLQQGGNLSAIEEKEKIGILFCLLEQEDQQKTEVFKEILLSIDNYSEVINVPISNIGTSSTPGIKKTLLVRAIAHNNNYNNYEIIGFLIGIGANVNARDDDLSLLDLTPLFYAIDREQKNIVKLLLENGANVNAKNKNNKTPLFYAKNPEVVRLLIEHGADVNARNNNGFTPLFYAKDPEVVRLLIEHSADVNAKDENNKTPLFYAIKNGRKNIVKLLLENGANVDTGDINAQIYLIDANNVYPKNIVEILLKNGVNVNGIDEDDQTALFHAVQKGQQDIVKLLLENSADVNHRNQDGQTPLFYAEDPEIAQLLIKYGADVDARNRLGETPLFKINNLEITKFLIESGANTNIRNYYSDNALFDAYNAGNELRVKRLIELGADINARDQDGRTLLFRIDDLEMIKFLIKHGADVNARDQDGRTLLFRIDDLETVKFLIEHGADVNARDNNGQTPLSVNKNSDIVLLLIENGANVNAVDHERKTPLFYADDFIAQILIQNGANINHRNNRGETYRD